MTRRSIIAAPLLALFATTAHAQSACLPTQQVYSVLADNHGESRVAVGIGADGASLIEVWGNRDTGSFTVFITGSNGTSCLAMSGVGLQVFQAEPNL
jgi:hypothetical protein